MLASLAHYRDCVRSRIERYRSTPVRGRCAGRRTAVAATPLTVTEDIPLFPNPESLAVPGYRDRTRAHRLIVRVAADRYRGTRGI